MSKTTKIIAALGVVAGLGVAALPMGAFAEDTTHGATSAYQEVDVTVNIGESISIAILDTEGDDKDITVEMEQNSINEEEFSTISVSTNSEAGYNLTVKDKDEETALVNQNEGKSEFKIEADTNIEAGTAAWAIKWEGSDGYKAMVSSDEEALLIKKVTQATDGLDETEIHYGFSTAPSQEQGSYQDTIVYTVAKNVN